MSASFACSWACLSTRGQDEALRTKVPLGGLYMDAQETGAHRTAKTILAAGLLLLVFFFPECGRCGQQPGGSRICCGARTCHLGVRADYHRFLLCKIPGIVETILQICFAFIFGIVFALVFITCYSIWLCIALHTFHDFCSFISAGGSELGNIVVGGVQFVTLLCYALVFLRKKQIKRNGTNA